MEGEVVPRSGTNWKVLVVVGVLAVVVWWVWRERSKKRGLPFQSNATPAPVPPAGIPLTLTDKMAKVVDTSIPVVMTSGGGVAHDEAEVTRVAKAVVARLNALGENVAVIKVTSASKTIDSYKTVAYELVVNAYDPQTNVGLLLSMSVLVPASGKMYVRTLKLYHEAGDQTKGPAPASDPLQFAAFESPLDVLSKVRLGQ